MTQHRTSLRLVAALLGIGVATTACGLKQGAVDGLKTTNAGGSLSGGVASSGGGGGGAVGTGVTGGTGGSSGTGSALAGGSTGLGGGTTGGSTGTTGGTGTTGSTGSTGTSPSASGGGSGACGTPTGGNTTGITASTINIGLHAPLTGTGTPFPNTSFKTGAQKFWDQPAHKVCGRAVSVDFQDDTYTPSGARTVCEAMARRDFLVIGGAGTDQIQACATDPVINNTGTPYLSAGVTDNGLKQLTNYFALSMTYEQQGSLVLANAKAHGFATPKASSDGKQWAIVTANTPNFEGARRGIHSALSGAGITYQDFQVNQNNGNYQADAANLGQQLALKGYKTIYVDLAPGYFIYMAGGYYSAATSTNDVMWAAPGVTFTEFLVAQLLCSGSKNAIDGHAQVLAPFPGIDRATDEFKKAYNNSYDDIEWSLWGTSEVIWQLLQKSSGNLTRQNFISSTLAATVPGGVYPPVAYAGRTHFGGTGAWVQQITCSKTEPNQNQPGSWTTVGSTYLHAS